MIAVLLCCSIAQPAHGVVGKNANSFRGKYAKATLKATPGGAGTIDYQVRCHVRGVRGWMSVNTEISVESDGKKLTQVQRVDDKDSLPSRVQGQLKNVPKNKPVNIKVSCLTMTLFSKGQLDTFLSKPITV